MAYLIFAIICSSGMALMTRHAENKTDNMKAVTVANYIICIIFCYAFLPEKNLLSPSGDERMVLYLGLFNGFLYLASFMMLQFSIRKNGTTISASVSHVGVLIPTLLSIFIFAEYPTSRQWIGVVIAIGAIILLSTEGDKDYTKIKSKFGLIMLLILGGSADMMSKIFDVYGNHSLQLLFLLCTFFIAGILSVFVLIQSKKKPHRDDFLYGSLIGLFNFLSSLFLLKAVIFLPAFFVYPVYSIGVILFVNVVNFLVLKEKLGPKDYIAIAAICVALAFMN